MKTTVTCTITYYIVLEMQNETVYYLIRTYYYYHYSIFYINSFGTSSGPFGHLEKAIRPLQKNLFDPFENVLKCIHQ